MLQALHPHRLPAQARSPLGSDASSLIGHDDWHTLFNAVLAQLRHTVAVRADANVDLQVRDAGRTQTRVLECVSALEKLQAARVPCDASGIAAAPADLYPSKGSS